MIKGQVFANQLFENQIFALFINTFTDGKDGVSDNYKNGMAITYSGSDVTIDSGAVLIQGRFLEEDTSTTISAGADNMYCKLVIEIDLDKTNTTTEFNQGYYKIVKSSTTWPTLTQTNIVKNVSGVYQYELARFRTTANGITDFEDRRTFIDFTSIYDEIREHIQAIDDESIFVLKSGSTMTGKLIAGGGIEGNVEGNLTGNSATASKLLTARTISLSGAVTGSVGFDGHTNVTINTTEPSYYGSWITLDMMDSTDGSGRIKFDRNGNTVQVTVELTIKTGKTSAMAVPQFVTIPTWARVNRGTAGELTPLASGGFPSNGTMFKSGGVTFGRIDGQYRIGAFVSINSAQQQATTYSFTSSYVL